MYQKKRNNSHHKHLCTESFLRYLKLHKEDVCINLAKGLFHVLAPLNEKHIYPHFDHFFGKSEPSSGVPENHGVQWRSFVGTIHQGQ